MNVDALVVGAGPAGLMAAETLAQAGNTVLVADAMPSPARKFLMAGKSGLNLTMDQSLDEFVSVYGDTFMAEIVSGFGPDHVVKFANDLGQETFVGSSKRVFPTVMKASPLLRAWLTRLRGLNVDIRSKWRWLGFGNEFSTPSGRITVKADVTILAMGGGSWRRLGANGEWIGQFQSADITTKPFQPSNMGIAFPWSRHMAPFYGTPLKPIVLRAGSKTVQGECVLTALGIEGSAIYNLSPQMRAKNALFVDLIPDVDLRAVIDRLSKPRGKETLTNWLRKSLKLRPNKLALLREWGRTLPNEPYELAKLIKNLPAARYEVFPLDEAISTTGGVPFGVLDQTLMIESMPGVFCAGEMLDWDAPTGGYLITGCLATGKWAGENAVRFIGHGPSSTA